jgi:hypothetical protein
MQGPVAVEIISTAFQMPDVIKFYLTVIYWYMFFGEKPNLHLGPNIGRIAQYWALHGSELNLR